jgi:aryl carrier-like protein
VRQVAVVPTASDAGRQLAAYISPLPGATLSAASARQHVRARLPEYMVPTHFVLLPDLPLSANGKIDRSALDLPGGTDRAAAPFVAPRSDIEQLVAAAWREVLQQDRLSVDDNFFDVGGHSLLLIKVLERLRAQLTVELSVLDLFRFPTIASLAAEIAGRTAAPVAASGPPMPPRTSATITDRAGMLRRALARPRNDVRIPPEAAS